MKHLSARRLRIESRVGSGAGGAGGAVRRYGTGTCSGRWTTGAARATCSCCGATRPECLLLPLLRRLLHLQPRRAAYRNPHRSPVRFAGCPQDPAVPSAPAEAPAPAAAPQAAPGLTPPAPAVAPRATVDGPAVLTIAPPQPAAKAMTLIAPKAPHAPGAAVLLVNPPNAARVKLMIQERATLANRELILASPGEHW